MYKEIEREREKVRKKEKRNMQRMKRKKCISRLRKEELRFNDVVVVVVDLTTRTLEEGKLVLSGCRRSLDASTSLFEVILKASQGAPDPREDPKFLF
jgi:hypothetical protein